MAAAMKRAIAVLMISWGTALPAFASKLIEPHMSIKPGLENGPVVALTLDACMGGADERILKAVIENQIPVTIFVTGRWLRHNPKAVADMIAHSELFELENHGDMHVPAVDEPRTVFGLPAAGSLEAVRDEVDGGMAAIAAAAGTETHWFRGATAEYSESAITLIEGLGYRIAGFSLNADGGAQLSAQATATRLAKAKDGDVIVAHLNQPKREAGLGVVSGILALKAKGFGFRRLDDAELP